MKIAFLDRDGTLIDEPQDTGKIDTLNRLKILPGVIDELQKLQKDGYKLVLVSNQDGIGTPGFPAESFHVPHEKFLSLLKDKGIVFFRIFICPHLLSDNCFCRKPKTGLVEEFLKENNIDKTNSFMCGDRETDREFAQNIGIRFISAKTNCPLKIDR